MKQISFLQIKNYEDIAKVVNKLNNEGYNVCLIPNINDLAIGKDCDILISTKKDYNIEKINSRLNLIKILIDDEDNEKYDMVLNKKDFEFNLLDKIKEKYLG